MNKTKNTAKAILAILALSLSYNASANDETTSSSSEYFMPSETPKLEYEINGTNVYLEWDKAENDEEFRYYKVVYSKDNEELVYPDDTTMQVIDNYSTNFYEGGVEEGFWRVCTVYEGYYANGDDSDYRSCSNVVFLEANNNVDWEYVKSFIEFMDKKIELSYDEFKTKVYSELDADLESGIIYDVTYNQIEEYIGNYLTDIANREAKALEIKWDYVNEFVKFMENNLDLSYDDFIEKTTSELKEDLENGDINENTYNQVKEYIYKYAEKLEDDQNTEDEEDNENESEEYNKNKVDYDYINDFVEFMENNLDLSRSEFKEKTMSELEEDYDSELINKRTYQLVKVKILKYIAKIKIKEEYNEDDSEDSDSSYEEKTQETELSDDLREKADKIIKSFRIKLNNSGLSNDVIIEKIGLIINRLENINTSNNKLELLVEYLIDQLEELKTEYDYSMNDIEELFDISE